MVLTLQNVLRIHSCSACGALGVLELQLQIFAVNYAPKYFFSALGGQVHPLNPMATPMTEPHCIIVLRG